jgi:hypothetical protein
LAVAFPPSVAAEVLGGAKNPQVLEQILKHLIALDYSQGPARRAAELLREVAVQRGPDHGVSTTDAEVAALTEQLGMHIVYTSDVEDFSALQDAGAVIVVRPVPVNWDFTKASEPVRRSRARRR